MFKFSRFGESNFLQIFDFVHAQDIAHFTVRAIVEALRWAKAGIRQMFLRW